MICRFTIYCHTNKVNGKRYVGQTVNSMEFRWKDHLRSANRNEGARLFGRALRKYGADAFEHEVLETVETQAEADKTEAKWIAQLRSRAPKGYNLAVGGGGPGYHHDDSKRLIASASKRQFAEMTPEQRAVRLATTIHIWTPERRARSGARCKTKKVREIVSSSQKRLWSKLTVEEKSARVRHQLAGMSSEEKSERVRKAWRGMTPEAREARVCKAARTSSVTKAKPAHIKKMSEWQTAQAKLRTPEQRQAMVLKAWETRRAKYGDRGHAKPSEVFSAATKKGWANMTPEARAERGRKIKEGRRKAKEARLAIQGAVA